MSRLLVLCLSATVVLVACADNILKERPVRAPSGSGPALSATSKSHSSVCASYRRQLHQVHLAQSLKQLSTRKAELRSKELSLNAVIADACE
ncbi:MAG TPA: hypothetical protein VK535_04865 [Gemmatimonadales bacterium]|jgi:hypothetical protein|nr:hypothetical protein [Gemmatimonadales bacterium]